jgi:hypothetical protein
MTSSLSLRDRLAVPGLCAAALLFGALIAARPSIAAGLVAAGAVLALAFVAPVTHLTLLLFLTAIVPYSVQNQSAGSAGLLPSDLFLLTGLVRAVVVLSARPLDRRRALAAGMCLVFLAGVLIHFLLAIRSGRDLSEVGAEFRQLLGYGVLFVALPVVLDPLGRGRLLKALLVLGLLLGLWGLAQWAFRISYGGAGDLGVRAGVRLTTAGRGQIQGGMFGFPVAVGIAYAGLISGEVRALRTYLLLLAVFALNASALLLTFERAFWVGAFVAIAFVTLRLGVLPRLRALVWLPLLAVVGVAALSALAPGELATARERLLSLNQYESDTSLRYRIVESQHVVAKIAEHPLTGSGLADTIFWGRPWANVPATTYSFSHNGYLWLAWKIGVPLTALLCVLILMAIFWRGPPEGSRLYAAVRTGCQGGLLALLVIGITWPSFRIPAITPVIGLFIAICATPRMSGAGRGAEAGAVGHRVGELASARSPT